MARIPAATRETVPSDQTDAFDQMLANLGSVPAYGPGSIMIHVPKAHQLATALNQYLRNDSSLPVKGMDRAENARQQLTVFRPLLEFHKL